MTKSPAVRSHVASRDRVIRVTIDLIASGGIRGATMRDIAAASGVTAATIAALFVNKDGLVAQCFADLAAEDRLALDTRIEQAERLALAGELAAPFLWTLVEDAWGARRSATLALIELWLATPGQAHLTASCRDWIVVRRDALRRLAGLFGAEPMAFDILGLHLLSESSFAVSCGGSYAYRLVAQAGFAEAVAWIAGLGGKALPGGVAQLSATFHADPDRGHDTPQPQARSAESRDRIIEAAAAIIEEEGLSNVTNRAVAERAGVSLALTTYHFKVVSELTFAGILRVFEKTNASLSSIGAVPLGGVAARIARRAQPSGVERLRSRGMAQISLAAARGSAPAGLGLDMRRQRGTLTHAAARFSGQAITRTRAASHALWSSAAFLVAAAIPDADAIFDFDAQGRMAAERLLDEG